MVRKVVGLLLALALLLPGSAAAAFAVPSFRDQSLRDIERWTEEPADGKITPEKALDRTRPKDPERREAKHFIRSYWPCHG